MNSQASQLDLHVFVCTNQKPNGKPCCADKGGKELRDHLKARIATHPELRGKVRINASGCLDRCTEGIACVLYPSGEWLTEIKIEDLDQLETMIFQRLSTKTS